MNSAASLNGTDSPPCFEVVVDTVIFTLGDHDLKIGLVEHKPGSEQWRLPGCSIAAAEAPDATARRQMKSLLGTSEVYLQQLYTFGAPERIPERRVISVSYFALFAYERLHHHDNQEQTEGIDWHSVYDLPPLAFDHGDIVDYALTRLRYKIEYSAVAFELLPDEFTLRELQEAYMIILNDHKLDKANFRKKIREADILEPISRYRETGGRPAKLYRVRPDAQLEVKARRFFP
ncbi:MAG: NUDIX hydrolase [Chloroflexi bacterium]|nr:NUDIX hydrolase [Chloroflexota bacterium]